MLRWCGFGPCGGRPRGGSGSVTLALRLVAALELAGLAVRARALRLHRADRRHGRAQLGAAEGLVAALTLEAGAAGARPAEGLLAAEALRTGGLALAETALAAGLLRAEGLLAALGADEGVLAAEALAAGRLVTAAGGLGEGGGGGAGLRSLVRLGAP